MSLRLAILTAVFSLLVLGCSGDDGAPGADTGTGSDAGTDSGTTSGRVELGTGSENFVEIPTSGATMELIAGPQGGWHVNVTARFYELTVQDLLLSYRIERDGEIISYPTEFLLNERRLIRDGDRWFRGGDFVRFEIEAPADVVGSTVDVIVVANPADANDVSDMRMGVTIVDDEP